MTAKWESRRSPAAVWSRRFGAFSAALFLTSALSHRFGLIETVPFLWLLGLCFVVALLGFGCGLFALVQIWDRGLLGLGSAILGVVLSLVTLGPYAVSAYNLATHPRLVDISTDLSRRPLLTRARTLRTPPMNPVGNLDEEEALLQAAGYPALTGRRYEHARENVIEAVSALMRERGWQVLTPVSPSDAADSVTVEAVAWSYLLGFPADVAIRIEDRADATYVDMRSASRYGRHDMGENAARIRRFLDDLDRRIEERDL
jgi:uncharacterized protein (DUF1499 family)